MKILKRASSSSGRAPDLHSGGGGFKSCLVHQLNNNPSHAEPIRKFCKLKSNGTRRTTVEDNDRTRMKYTVHVTVSFSMDLDPKELGIKTKKQLLEYAKSNYFLEGSEFDAQAKIFDTYDDKPNKPVRRGIGSH